MISKEIAELTQQAYALTDDTLENIQLVRDAVTLTAFATDNASTSLNDVVGSTMRIVAEHLNTIVKDVNTVSHLLINCKLENDDPIDMDEDELELTAPDEDEDID